MPQDNLFFPFWKLCFYVPIFFCQYQIMQRNQNSNESLQLLFSEIGELKRYSIHYDKSGRSKGTAEVVYARQSSALAAIKRYNNMKLDGKPLQIELVGVNLVGPPVVPRPFTGSLSGRPSNDVFGR